MRGFNVDILKDNNQPKNKQELLYFMDKFQLKSQFSENTTRAISQLDHIWANVLGNKCKSHVTKAYCQIFTNRFILHSNYQTHFQCITKNH
jgi:hypothetical protein